MDVAEEDSQSIGSPDPFDFDVRIRGLAGPILREPKPPIGTYEAGSGQSPSEYPAGFAWLGGIFRIEVQNVGDEIQVAPCLLGGLEVDPRLKLLSGRAPRSSRFDRFVSFGELVRLEEIVDAAYRERSPTADRVPNCDADR